jgi:hypothetical protein
MSERGCADAGNAKDPRCELHRRLSPTDVEGTSGFMMALRRSGPEGGTACLNSNDVGNLCLLSKIPPISGGEFDLL